MHKISDFYNKQLMTAFHFTMFKENTTSKRTKRFRVLFFAYMFGAVNCSALDLLFQGDPSFSKKTYDEIHNNNNNLLLYLRRSNYLIKAKDPGYIITDKGVSALFEYLESHGFLFQADIDTFKQNCRTSSRYVSHSVNTGLSILHFLSQMNASFYFEPYLNTDLEIINHTTESNIHRTITPDAILYSDEPSETYYIEADSCKERIGQRLVPKLQNYQQLLLSNEASCADTTILFSLRHDNIDHASLHAGSHAFMEIISFLSFFHDNLSDSITFHDVYEALLKYEGENSYLSYLKKSFDNLPVPFTSSIEDIKFQLDYLNINAAFDKKIKNRLQTLFNSIRRICGFKTSLLHGTRLICLPLYKQYNLYKYICFEHYKYQLELSVFLSLLFTNIHIINYNKLHGFNDIKSGVIYHFRNVFETKYKNDSLYVIVENITEDLGGLIRIQRYLSKSEIHIQEHLVFICIYNEEVMKHPRDFFPEPNLQIENVVFVSYSEYLKQTKFS